MNNLNVEVVDYTSGGTVHQVNVEQGATVRDVLNKVSLGTTNPQVRISSNEVRLTDTVRNGDQLIVRGSEKLSGAGAFPATTTVTTAA